VDVDDGDRDVGRPEEVEDPPADPAEPAQDHRSLHGRPPVVPIHHPGIMNGAARPCQVIREYPAMDLDDPVCLCFRVSRRKLVTYVRTQRPRVASQLSQCGGAGTGCGWCVPFLEQIFRQGTESTELEALTAEEYARGRAEYIRTGKGTPPPGVGGEPAAS
jgi:bacterioferritin-associated ferredoxin